MTPTSIFNSRQHICRVVGSALVVVFGCLLSSMAMGQNLTPEMLEEASRRTGMSKSELQRLYQERTGDTGMAATTDTVTEPGRTAIAGIDDRYPGDLGKDAVARVVLSGEGRAAQEALRDTAAVVAKAPVHERIFGTDFFHLDAGVFQPPSFGPVPVDYRLGVGDEIVINAWGEIDFQLTRVVDRDGAILLPRAGKVICAGRTLAEAGRAISEQLARSHASIGSSTKVETTLGQLRAIRVYVIGGAIRPGSYELSSASTILTALYAAGGPSTLGSFRDIRLMRAGDEVARLDLYTYLVHGEREGDILLHEGDTVFISDRLRRVQVTGQVRRPMYYEIKEGETLASLIGYAGGFTPRAALERVHIERILAPAARQPGQPDHVFLDVPIDPSTGRAQDGREVVLQDGDVVTVNPISERLDRYVEVRGGVKVPGRYQHRDGMTVADLVVGAGGLWPDALTEKAVIDRTSPERDLYSLTIPLGAMLSGRAAPVPLEARDVLHVFSRWSIQKRPQVHINGEVFRPFSEDFREGMTLRELVLKAGGLKDSADLLQAEVSRLRLSAVSSRDTSVRPEQTVDVLMVELGQDFLNRDDEFALAPYDRVVVRRLPWWEMQRTVTVSGEVFYPGSFSLERKDETLTSLIARAGGLTPDAYVLGARVVRSQDGVGNIAVDLAQALAKPGLQHDIILQDGDEVIVPDRMFTVKIVGEVGFPTSLIYEDGRDINWYVRRAGGYLEKADKGKTRVVWPNGMSLPNKGGPKVVAGSTIIVPMKPPPEGATTLETMRDISGILMGLATVWLVIDRTN